MITLQAGKCYRTRDGRKVGPMRRTPGSIYPFGGSLDSIDFAWKKDGLWNDDKEESPWDLVAEWTDEPAPSPDPVSAPAHYTSGTIECIDAIEAMLTVDEFRGFLRGNVQKYLWRHRLKGNSAEDLSKASWYLDRLKRLEASCPHCHRPHTDPMVCGRGGCPMGGDQ